MKVISFDVETTGFPDRISFDMYYPPSDVNRYDNSRVIQLGYCLIEDGVIIKEYVSKVKPNGFEIKNSDIHGITTEMAEINGKDLDEVLIDFGLDLEDVDKIIAYNLPFDKNCILSEAYRVKNENLIKKFGSIMSECVLQKSKNHLKQRKWPKLVDAYSQIVGLDIVQKHDALEDSRLCGEIYIKLSKC